VVVERDARDGARFERMVLPHLDAGYTLALYLTHDASDAEDAVQESVLRALRYFHTLRDDRDARAWFLAIVRRESYGARGGGRAAARTVPYDEGVHGEVADGKPSPEDAAQSSDVAGHVRAAIATLPDRLRETLILREIQQCSYEEIAMITDAPIGTVMSRLSRARARLAEQLTGAVDLGELP
jgi:RNA polymerase sigma-70 factor (ECF subfamily)